MLAIFSESFFQKCGSLFPQKDGFLIASLTLISISSLVKIGIYKQIGVIGLPKSKKNHWSDIFPAKC